MPAAATTMQRGMRALFGAVGDGAVGVTYQQTAPGTYSAATGDYTPGSTTETPVALMLSDFSADEVTPDVIPQTDRKGTMQQADLAGLPSATDTLRLPDGQVYTVQGVAQDTLRSVWVLHLRTTGGPHG